MPTGRLIVLEGSEGAGKTTQIRLLAEKLRSHGFDVLPVREPGGTALGDAIRGLLLDPTQHITPAAEALLFMASRAQLMHDEIDPALERGVVVLMDRFFLSTYAYQVDGRGLPEAEVRESNALATCGRVPDLTIVLSITAAEGMDRATARGAQDRIEQLGDDFHARVESAFSRFASSDWQREHPESGPVVAVDGRGEPAQVHERVLAVLAASMPAQFAALMKREAC
jgi:dTMP kinase